MNNTTARMADASIAVYWLDPGLGEAGECHELEAWLDEDERARAARLRFEHDRVLFIAAHALKRAALSHHAGHGHDPRDWTFVPGAHGKPRVAGGGPAFSFSLSHARGCVAVAIAKDIEIGLDVEAIVAATATLDVASAFCTTAELNALSALTPAQQVKRFFELWTLKESALKALGHGFSLAPTVVSFGFGPLAIRAPATADPAVNTWHVWSGEIGQSQPDEAADPAPSRLREGASDQTSAGLPESLKHAVALSALTRGGERPRIATYQVAAATALAAGIAPEPVTLALSVCSSSAISRDT